MSLKNEVEEAGQAAEAVASRWKTWATVGLIIAGLIVGGFLLIRILF